MDVDIATTPASSKLIANLSCVQCQRRKRKCDKTNPCQACQQAGIACTPVSRARLPRGRHLSQKDSDLRQRVARLEKLLSIKDGEVPLEATASDETNLSNESPGSAWSTVSKEVVGIRELLDDLAQVEIEPELEDSTTGVRDQSFDVLLYSDSSCFVQPHVLQPPPPAMVSLLLDLYFTRIDSVFKVTHAPSLRMTFSLGNPLTPAQEALKFALLFTAVNGLNEHESLQLLGESKETLSNRFKLAVEVLLSQCGLLTTTKLVVLQAFVVYLAGLRSCKGPRAVCVLLGTAVRIAQFLGLDLEKTKHSPFDSEIRRRIWYSIGILELQAAFDSGSYSAIVSQASLKASPLHINDEDISHGDLALPQPRKGFTDMTFACASYEMLRYMRKMIHTPLDSDGQPIPALQPNWRQRYSIVDDCARCLNENFITMCNLADRFQCFTKLVCEAMIVTLRLLAHRPMYRIYSSEPPPNDGFNVLNVATEVLEQCLRKVEATEFKQWEWFAWSKWYVLSIVLAELCEHVEGPAVDRAWVAAEACFERFRTTIQDPNIWGSIEKLMQKARSARTATIISRADNSAKTSSYLGITQPAPTTPLSELQFPASNGYEDPYAAQVSWGDQEMLSWTSWEDFIQGLGDSNQLDDPFPHI